MYDGDVFFFDALPLVLQGHFNFAALCEDKRAAGPLVEAVDGKDYFFGPEITFADIVVEDVLDGMCFVG